MRLSLNFILLLTLRQLSSSSQYLFIILMNIWKLLFLHLLYVQHEMKIGREFFFFCINFLLLQFLLLILLYCWFISFIFTLLLCYLFSCSTSQITSYYVCLYTVGNEIENFFFFALPSIYANVSSTLFLFGNFIRFLLESFLLCTCEML